MGVFTAAAGVLSVNFIGNLPLLKHFVALDMPCHCSIILGVALGALTVLSALGTGYFLCFMKQFMRAFGRWRKNVLSAADGKAVLPSLPLHPRFAGKTKRMLRAVSMIAVIVFAVCFVSGFAACVITAGRIEFWHAWGWFGYAG